MKKDIISKNTGNSHGFYAINLCFFISMFDADAAYVSFALSAISKNGNIAIWGSQVF